MSTKHKDKFRNFYAILRYQDFELLRFSLNFSYCVISSSKYLIFTQYRSPLIHNRSYLLILLQINFDKLSVFLVCVAIITLTFVMFAGPFTRPHPLIWRSIFGKCHLKILQSLWMNDATLPFEFNSTSMESMSKKNLLESFSALYSSELHAVKVWGVYLE